MSEEEDQADLEYRLKEMEQEAQSNFQKLQGRMSDEKSIEQQIQRDRINFIKRNI